MWIIAKYIKYIVIFGVLWFALISYRTFSCHKIYDTAMEPGIKCDEFKTVRAGQRAMDQIQIGDVVFFQCLTSARQETPYFCGRVVAKEGDRVEIMNGKIKLNGQDKTEAYVQADAVVGTENFAEIIIPRGHYFILGDNRKMARLKDSRAFGPIPLEALVGKVSEGMW